jgi:hypothetical protein
LWATLSDLKITINFRNSNKLLIKYLSNNQTICTVDPMSHNSNIKMPTSIRGSAPSARAPAARTPVVPALGARISRPPSGFIEHRSASVPFLDDQVEISRNDERPASQQISTGTYSTSSEKFSPEVPAFDDRGPFPGQKDRIQKEAQERVYNYEIFLENPDAPDAHDDESDLPDFPSDRSTKAHRQRELKKKAASAASANIAMSST